MEDFLKITDRTSKIVEYDRKRGIVFMLNKEKPSSSAMRLYCIKLKNVENNGSDSDDDNRKKRALSFGGDIQGSFKFDYIREVKLELKNQVL